MKEKIIYSIFSLGVLIIGLSSLCGCATKSLYVKDVDVYIDKQNFRKYQVFAETEQIYASQERTTKGEEYVKFYVPFRVAKNETQNKAKNFPPIDRGYFITKGFGKIDDAQILKSILNSKLKMLFVLMRKTGDGKIWFDVYYDKPIVTGNEILFVKNNINIPSHINIPNSIEEVNKSFISSNIISKTERIIIMLNVNKKWREEYKKLKWRDSKGHHQILPVAWIDSTGNYTYEPIENKCSGLLLVCKPNDYGVKYVKLMFDVSFFGSLREGGFTTYETEYRNTLLYHTGYPNKDISFVEELDTSKLIPLITLSDSQKMKIIFFYDDFETVYVMSERERMAWTPLAVLFDILTSPFQAVYFLFGGGRGPG